MGNGWIRTNVNGFKNHFFVTDFALPMDTAGYAPAIASYEEKSPNFNVPFCTFSFTQRLKVVIGTPMVLEHSDILG